MGNRKTPEIRFAGFSEEWEPTRAKKIFASIIDKNHADLPVLSASQEKGMIYRDEIGIDIKYDEKSTSTYKRVIPGQYVMHLRSFQGGFAYSEIEGITSPAYTVLDFIDKETHYTLFWKNIFTSKSFIKRLETITYGIRDGRSISFADFSTLKFYVPHINEQTKIGIFFKQLDDTIAILQGELDWLKQTKRGFLQKMFPKEGESVPEIRFPGFCGKWEVVKLSTLMDFSNGINAPKENYGKGRKMISVMDILADEAINYEGIRNSVEVDSRIENKNKVEYGDLVFVRSSESLEEVGYAKAYLQDEYALYSGFSIRGKKKKCFDAYFVELSLNNSSRRQFERKAGGSTRYNISQSVLNSIVIKKPGVEEQTQIGNFFTRIDGLIRLKQRELEILQQTQKAFLQKMFI